MKGELRDIQIYLSSLLLNKIILPNTVSFAAGRIVELILRIEFQ